MAKTRKVLFIPGWHQHFENDQSRRYPNTRWLPIPNSHDGNGYRRIAALGDPDAARAFTAFLLTAQVASKCPIRGVLYDKGEPLDMEDLAFKTGYPMRMFEDGIAHLTGKKVGWLAWGEITENGDLSESTQSALGAHSEPGGVIHGLNRKEKKRKEKKERPIDSNFELAWQAFGKYGVKKKALEYWNAYTKPDDLAAIQKAIPDYLACVTAGRTKSQFEGWINPRNRKWDCNWKAVLKDLTKPDQRGSKKPAADRETEQLEEWKRIKSSATEAILLTMRMNKGDQEEIARTIRTLRDKYPNPPKWNARDPITAALETARTYDEKRDHPTDQIRHRHRPNDQRNRTSIPV